MARTLSPEDRATLARYRAHPLYCRVYARRTPRIPFHNGLVASPCIGCRAIIPAAVAEIAAWRAEHAR